MPGPAPTVALPVAIGAAVVAGHIFSLGTHVTVHVKPQGVGIDDADGGVRWESPRAQI
mgnify:CR=1 FL=1